MSSGQLFLWISPSRVMILNPLKYWAELSGMFYCLALSRVDRVGELSACVHVCKHVRVQQHMYHSRGQITTLAAGLHPLTLLGTGSLCYCLVLCKSGLPTRELPMFSVSASCLSVGTPGVQNTLLCLALHDFYVSELAPHAYAPCSWLLSLPASWAL